MTEKHEKYITYRANRKIYQIKLTVPVQQQDGKIIRKPITRQAKTLEEAIQARTDLVNMYKLDKSLLVEIADTKAKTRSKLSSRKQSQAKKLDKLIVKWYETYKRPFVGYKTRNNYDTAIYHRIIPAFGGMDVDILTRDLIQRWIISVQQTNHMSQETVRAIICKLHGFFNYLIDAGLVEKNPCRDIKFVKTQKKVKRTISAAERIKILAAAKETDYVYYVLFYFLFYSGVRRGEALGLRWCDIDFERGVAHIENTIQMTDTGTAYVKPTPKNDSSIRDIPLTDALINGFLRLKSYYVSYDDGIVSDYVFRLRKKQYLIPNSVSHTFADIAVKAGVQGVSIHCTRHTMATSMIHKGVPIPVIQAIGGWGTAKTLLSNYVHISSSDIRDALENNGGNS